MRHFRGEGEQAHIELPALEIGGVECLIVSEGDLYGVADAEILEVDVAAQEEKKSSLILPKNEIIMP